MSSTTLLKWLLGRVSARAKTFHPNRLYASEILSMLLQNSESVQKALEGTQGVDALLVAAAPYKKRDPAGEDERELCENIFQCLCSALMQPVNKAEFRQAEGIELMLMIIREKKYGRKCAVKVLDYLLTNDPLCCEHCVDAGGLKSIFPVFMGKSLKKKYHDQDEMRAVEELGRAPAGSLRLPCRERCFERGAPALQGCPSWARCSSSVRASGWCDSSVRPPFPLLPFP